MKTGQRLGVENSGFGTSSEEVLKSECWVQQQQQQEKEPMESSLLGPQISLFLSEVSVAGLRYVADCSARWPRRLLWLCLVLFGTTFMSYQIQQQVRYYLSHPTSINLEAKYNRTLQFPAVTICNQNKVSRKWADNLGKQVSFTVFIS